MLSVVCNTSPLQYLYQLGSLDILRALYGQVRIPTAVASEIAAGQSSGIAVPALATYVWISIESVRSPSMLVAVADLGAGEREVLALGIQSEDPLLILDDALARRYAALLHLRKTGTLGVLVKAKRAGLVASVAPLLDRLEQLGFRMDANLRLAVLKQAGE